MFGYVRPFRPELKVREEEFYKGIYCGICRAQRKYLGDAASLTLSYDSVFLALVRIISTGESFTVTQRFCPVHPLKKRAIASDCEALRYAATASALLAYYSLRDNISDTRGLRRAKYFLAVPFFEKLRQKAVTLSSLDKTVRSGLERLSALEKAKCPHPDELASAFGEVMREIACHGLDGGAARVAGEIGYHLGKWLYFIDAADDFSRDIKNGEFNPFVCAEMTTLDTEAVRSTLLGELSAMAAAFELLPEQDGERVCEPEQRLARSLTANIIYIGLKNAGERVLLAEKS